MRFAVCLHAGAVVRSALPLHETDYRAILLGRATGAEVLVIEAVAHRGCAPRAVTEALAAGASQAVRVVDPALESADAHATGFVLATALDPRGVDLIMFGADADPEGAHDVPACIAHHMSAVYLNQVLDLVAATGEGGPAREGPALEITVRLPAWICRLQVPLDAVIGIAPQSGRHVATRAPGPGDGQAAAPGAVEVVTLDDLKMDPALVRSRDDRRGVIDVAARPLVTLQSGAAIAALLAR